MDSQNTFDKYYPLLKHHWLPLSLGLFGLIFLGYGLIALLSSSNSSNEIIFEPGADSRSLDPPSNQDKVSEIVVDVEGAVLKPGVYTLAANSRLSDGLIAAGGLSSDADRDWIAKNLNFAVKLGDGAKIYVPRVGEDTKGIAPLRPPEADSAGQAGSTGTTDNSQININTASKEILDSLPGIGPVTAQKIINGRPYSSVDELLSRKIVGSKVFEQIKDKITVY